MTTPSTPFLKRPTLARPRPFPANTSAFPSGNSNREASLPSNFPSLEKSPLLSPSTMLARKASLNQLTQNSLASIPDGSVGYGLGSPTRSGREDGGGTFRGRATPIGADVEVGDAVNTPGGMHGTVKFIGNVKGKAGVFVGVELDPDMFGRGKNDGAVDGVRYFTTAQPNSGIFVPLARATKRLSASSSNAPPTPTLLNLPSPIGPSQLTPPTPSRNRSESPSHRFANGIGKAPNTRPSFPRPESPVRRGTPGPGPRPSLHPPVTPRNVSLSGGGRFGAPSPTPGKLTYGRVRASSISSTNDGRPGTAGGGPLLRLAQTPGRSGYVLGLKQPKSTMGLSNMNNMLRTGSSMGMRSISSLDRHPEEQLETSPIDSGIGMARTEELERSGATAEMEAKLAEKDDQLKEQAAALLEMEASLSELQSLVQNASSPQLSHFASPTISARSGSFEDADSTQLRALLREKNEKIQILTAEFDAHRADFRSTIDTLELASTETERVYERRVDDLTAEIRELQDRNEDVESVARQLKQLEELVAELEEGLEDARRGEAEARGEVEFLRGEVERSREELRREREKSAAAVANAAVGKMIRSGSTSNDEVEKKDDEIRGLKAIIHSLSRDAVSADDGTNGDSPHPDGTSGIGRRLGSNGEVEELAKERMTREKLEKEVGELETLIERRAAREEELEKEIELLKKRKETRSSTTNASEKTVTGWAGRDKRDSGRDSRTTIGSWRAKHQQTPSSASSLLQQPAPPPPESSTIDDTSATGSGGLTPITAEDSESADGSILWCEICETAGHDILTCTNMFGSAAGGPASAGPEGEKTATAAAAAEGAQDDSKPLHTTSTMERVESTDSAFPGYPTENDDGEFKRTINEAKKSVRLPPPPPMVESGFGPVPGKESRVVDMNKWCALCEREGHESFDCPIDIDY